MDSFGDGWNGAELNVTNIHNETLIQGMTLEAGSILVTCVDPSEGVVVSVSNGDFPSEISWTLETTFQTLRGGAGQSAREYVQETDDIVLELIDTYGDGWNGAMMRVLNCNLNEFFFGTLVMIAIIHSIFSMRTLTHAIYITLL
jgi:hypothetical protein